ncbi:MAG: DUF2782 domain-containing protein [Oleibacter sp.]|nr:DUF2782 domain-containing protein [Thalassolituus sp.]
MKHLSLVLAGVLFASLFSTLFVNTALAEEPIGETITIRNDGDNTYYEFRVNGEISEIKVQPKVGPAYYLVPATDDTGDFVRRDMPNMRIPKWVLFRW